MGVPILEGSMEARVLHILLEAYPVTLEDLLWELGISPAILNRTLKKLESQGIVQLEPLPPKTFVRLLRTDFQFSGNNPTQSRRFKQKRGRSKPPKDPEGPMFG